MDKERPTNTKIWFGSLILALAVSAVQCYEQFIHQVKSVPSPAEYAWEFGQHFGIALGVTFVLFKLMFQFFLPWLRKLDHVEYVEDEEEKP